MLIHSDIFDNYTLNFINGWIIYLKNEGKNSAYLSLIYLITAISK